MLTRPALLYWSLTWIYVMLCPVKLISFRDGVADYGDDFDNFESVSQRVKTHSRETENPTKTSGPRDEFKATVFFEDHRHLSKPCVTGSVDTSTRLPPQHIKRREKLVRASKSCYCTPDYF